ncbi:MAG: hypothetical protein LBU99_02940, partial [Spirochaetaceae bacterium]|nr:hypothetical protein [Spirochaetaceae bacterium]
MKKLTGMLVIAVLAIGSISAQRITMNYRTQAAVVSLFNDANSTFVDFFSLDENAAAYAPEAKDDLEIMLTGDYAGAAVILQPTLKGSAITFDAEAYYGWVTFGHFNMTAGRFDSRYTDRVNNYGGNYSGYVGEYVRLGGLKKTTMIEDAANFG